MSFANPMAWLLALAAIPIIICYILKVRLKRVPVSTNLFWRQLFDEKPPRSIWQVLRHLLSLCIQLALLALLVIALTDPFLAWQARTAQRLVLVIDNSASMRATDASPSRLAAALDAARSWVDRLGYHDQMAIVLAGPRPAVLLGMTSHIPTLKRTLDDIQPSDNPTQLDSAIHLGRQLIGDHSRGQVVVFTDGCVTPAPPGPAASTTDETPAEPQAEPPAEPTREATVTYQLVGQATANVGITRFQVRRSLIDALGYHVLIHVHNAGPAAVRCRVDVDLDGIPVDVLPLELAPNETWTRSLEKTSLTGGRLSAQLTQIAASDLPPSTPASPENSVNGLTTDDVAWAVLPARPLKSVLLITPGNLFLQKVLEANPLVQLEVRKELPAAWPSDTWIVLHRLVPPELPPGDVWVIDPAADCNAWKLGAPLDDPLITQQDSQSPLMAHVRLDNVVLPEARRLEFAVPHQALASAVTGEPIYATWSRAGSRCAVLTVNLDRGDLTFRTVFPILVSNALSWVTGGAGELRESLATTATLPIEEGVLRGAKLDALQLLGPDGQAYPATSPLGPFEQCGVWTLVPRTASHQTKRPASGSSVAAPAQVISPPLASAQPNSRQPDSRQPDSRQPDSRQPDSRQPDSGQPDSGPSASAQPGSTQPGAVSVGVPPQNPAETTFAQSAPLLELAVNLANERETDLRPSAELAELARPAGLGANWFARPLWYYLLLAATGLFVGEWFLYQRRVIA